MDNQVINSLAIDIANLHVRLAQSEAENAQLKAQLAEANKKDEEN
ncbi:hypothetical protein [Weissella paramesenteroides]|nr:hypothetical protein [Weissella paramesenteroides]